MTERGLMAERLERSEMRFGDQESEVRFRQITENMLDVIAQTDLVGTCEYASPSMKAVLGYDPKDMLAKSMFEYIHPDDFDNVLGIVRKALVAGTTEKFEYRYRHADGHYVWLESCGNPLFDEKGQMIGAVLSSRDITERKQMEDAVRNSERKYRALFEKIPQGIYQTSLEGKLMTANPALIRLLGHDSEEELLAVNVEHDLYVNPEDRTTWMERIRTQGEVRDAELVLKRKDGEEVTVLDNAHLVHDEHANPVYYEGTLTDITARKRMEDELRRLSQFRESVVDNAHVWIDVLDEKANVVVWNRAAEAISGYSREEVIGHDKIWEWLYPDEKYRTYLTRLVADVVQHGRVEEDFETTIRRKDGQIRTISWNERSLVDELGKTIGSIAIGRDITQRKRAEEALRESEARYRTLFDSTNDAIFIHDMGRKFLEVNKVFCELLGYSSEELLQMTPADISSPEYASQVAPRLAELRQVGRAFFESAYVRRDGTIIPIELSSRIIDYKGKPAVLSIARDITERKRAKEALLATEAKYRQLVENIDEIIYAGQFGTSAMVSPLTFMSDQVERILGYRAKEFLYDPSIWGRSLHPDDMAEVQATTQMVFEGKNTVRVYRMRKRYSEEYCWLEDHIVPQVDSTGRVTGYFGVARDITERKQIERMKDQFVSTVSHELRTPLTSIRASLGLLASGVSGALPEKGQRMLEIAVTNTDRLVRLINDILDSERLASGKTPMEKKQCGAAQLVTQAADVMKPMADKAGISLSVQSQDAALWADPDRIAQALTNLIGNAIKFSPKGGRIWVTAERKENQMLFKVRDEGRGIPPDKLGLLFERFQQVDASDAREKGGTGLGLSISKSIVEQHNGRIWAESTIGKGSTFFFTLPLPQETQVPAQPEAMTEAQCARRVLIIEDDPDLANILATMLQRHDIQPYLALTGQKGITLSKQIHPGMIVLDLGLPDMDGSAVVQALREDNTLRLVPLVVYTVRELDNQQRENLRLGETLFFTKSRIPPDQFEEKVVQFMKRIHENRGKTSVS